MGEESTAPYEETANGIEQAEAAALPEAVPVLVGDLPLTPERAGALIDATDIAISNLNKAAEDSKILSDEDIANLAVESADAKFLFTTTDVDRLSDVGSVLKIAQRELREREGHSNKRLVSKIEAMQKEEAFLEYISDKVDAHQRVAKMMSFIKSPTNRNVYSVTRYRLERWRAFFEIFRESHKSSQPHTSQEESA